MAKGVGFYESDFVHHIYIYLEYFVYLVVSPQKTKPQSTALSVTPQSTALSVTPQSTALSVTPQSTALFVTPQSTALSVTPQSTVLSVLVTKGRRKNVKTLLNKKINSYNKFRGRKKRN